MPLWGIALAVGPNYNMDVDAEREKLDSKPSKRLRNSPQMPASPKRTMSRALLTRYSGDANPDYKKLSRDYAAAMKALSEKYPDDLDAATFYAESLMDLNPWKLWSHDGKPAENTEEIVARAGIGSGARPQSRGGESLLHSRRGSFPESRSARCQARIAWTPWFRRQGIWSTCPRTFTSARAIRRGSAQQRRSGKGGPRLRAEGRRDGSIYDLMYHSHNEHFQAMAASMEGNYAQAKKAADAMAARLHAARKDDAHAGCLHHDAHLGRCRVSANGMTFWPAPSRFKELPGTHAMWRYSRALAFAAGGKIDAAEKERELLCRQKRRRSLPDAMFGEQNKANDVFGCCLSCRSRRASPRPRARRTRPSTHWTESRGDPGHPELRRTRRLVLPGSRIAGGRAA